MQPYINLDSLTFSFLALELAICLIFHIALKPINLFSFKKKYRQIANLLISFLISSLIAAAVLGLETLQHFIIGSNKIFFLPLVTVVFVYYLAISKHFLFGLFSYGALVTQLFAFCK